MMSVRTARPLAGLLSVLIALGASAQAVAAVEPPPSYLAIQRAFLREEFEMVATLASGFLSDYPDLPETARVRIWLLLSLDRLGRSTEALQELDVLSHRLAPDDPLRAEVLFWDGDISRRASQPLRAKLAYQQLLERYSDSTWAPLAQSGLGLLYIDQHAFEFALQHFRQLAVQQAGTPLALEASLFEGFCTLRLKRFKEAVKILQPLLERLSDPAAKAQAALYLGESLTGLARYDEALKAYQRAAAADAAPWSTLALFGVGWAHFRAGHCPESVEAFERYLTHQMSEHRTEALFAQGSCLLEMGREGQALALFEQVVARDPDHPLALEAGLVIIDAYRRQERFPLAKGLLHTLLRRPLDPGGRAQLHLRLAAIALDQGNAAQAQTVFRLAAENTEPSIRQAALNGLGDVQLFLGQLERAQAFYEEAVQTAEGTPLTMYATYQLARIHLQLGDSHKAVMMLWELVGHADPSFADDARLALALAYLHQGEEELARTQLTRIRQQRPTSVAAARGAYYQALLALGQDDETTAQRLCRETVARAPRSDEAADARLLLADLLARRTSVRDAMGWLRDLHDTAGLSARHRAKLAKRLGDFAREEGAYAEAIRWYDEAATLLPSLNAEATYRQASCYEDGGDVELAMRWYGVVDQPPWRVRGQLALAKLLERLDRLEAAQALYEALAREPIPEAKVAQERLAALRGDILSEE